MREIKFRIWNKIDKKMIVHNPVDTKRFLIDMNGNIGCMDLDTMKWSGLIPDQYIEIMRYTGLKDRNGKEIYEGDIAKYFSLMKDQKVLGVVTFENGSFLIEECYLSNKKIEVIGNIYENPELLEVEE